MCCQLLFSILVVISRFLDISLDIELKENVDIMFKMIEMLEDGIFFPDMCTLTINIVCIIAKNSCGLSVILNIVFKY